MTRRLQRTLKIIGLAGLGLFAVLQFVPYGRDHTNPAVVREPAWDRPATRALAVRACFDCHSNQTRWRWYTYVAPVSWLTVGHVNQGREDLNFSIWGSYGARMRETRLRAICRHSQDGSMPLPSYTLVHPETKLSPDEIRSICQWTDEMRGVNATRHPE